LFIYGIIITLVPTKPINVEFKNKTMARLPNNSPFAGASGRFGNAVLYMSNGIPIIRALPGTPRKRKSSELQKLHISSFQALHHLARSVKRSIIDRVWNQDEIPLGLNPYNYFIKCNRNAFAKTDHVEYPQLITLCNGRLLPAKNLNFKLVEKSLQINWTCTVKNSYAEADDCLNVVLLIERKAFFVLNTTAIRKDEKATIEIPSIFENISEGFVFWSLKDDSAFSRSEYWNLANEI
jgi:hypothetical protein